MKHINLKSIAVSAAITLASAGASAGLVAVDGWKLITPAGSTSGIGFLSIASGSAVVEQEVNGAGNPFVGAKFVESGAVFSLNYIPESTPGIGDIFFGFPPSLHENIAIAFTGVSGMVTSLGVGGSFNYSFTSGTYSFTGSASGLLGGGSIVGLGGTIGVNGIVGGSTGTSTILATLLSGIGGAFSIEDASGNPLLPAIGGLGGHLFEVTTNNTLPAGNPAAAACIDASLAGDCKRFTVNSAGQGYMFQVVPEPGSLALVGLGLVGVGVLRRRKMTA